MAPLKNLNLLDGFQVTHLRIHIRIPIRTNKTILWMVFRLHNTYKDAYKETNKDTYKKIFWMVLRFPPI